jgi:hypothetical protein
LSVFELNGAFGTPGRCSTRSCAEGDLQGCNCDLNLPLPQVSHVLSQKRRRPAQRRCGRPGVRASMIVAVHMWAVGSRDGIRQAHPCAISNRSSPPTGPSFCQTGWDVIWARTAQSCVHRGSLLGPCVLVWIRHVSAQQKYVWFS